MLASALYLSKEKQPFNHSSLAELVAKAQEKNKTLGITGFIRYKNGSFIQYIEGSEEAINEMKNTLKQDKRHDIIVWLYNDISERKFDSWSMHHIRNKTLEDLDVSTFILEELSQLTQASKISKQSIQILWQDVGVIAKHHNQIRDEMTN